MMKKFKRDPALSRPDIAHQVSSAKTVQPEGIQESGNNPGTYLSLT